MREYQRWLKQFPRRGYRREKGETGSKQIIGYASLDTNFISNHFFNNLLNTLAK